MRLDPIETGYHFRPLEGLWIIAFQYQVGHVGAAEKAVHDSIRYPHWMPLLEPFYRIVIDPYLNDTADPDREQHKAKDQDQSGPGKGEPANGLQDPVKDGGASAFPLAKGFL